MVKKRRLSLDELVNGVLSSNRVILSRAITLIESKLAEDRAIANQLLDKILPHTGNSFRLGITGVPGVGKSTFIEHFGKIITNQNQRLAVLAIDPSSKKTKGSILGDKTRMESLSKNKNAFIRPSSAADTLGGVASKTRESMLLCEAAGFDFIIVETVGVGQSETMVSEMVDFFLLLMLAGAGDELQGIKKGIMEMADLIAITKADSGNEDASKKARSSYQNALHLFPPHEAHWIPQVLSTSSLTGKGMQDVIDQIKKYEVQMKNNGFFEEKRNRQKLQWMHEAIHDNLLSLIYKNENLKKSLTNLEEKVLANQMHSMHAAEILINKFINQQKK